MTRLAALEARVAALGHAVVAFSGGVDSSRRRRDRLPRARRQRARRHRGLAVRRAGRARGREAGRRAIGIATRSCDTNELARPGYRANGRDRCYFCKTELYDTLAAHYPGVHAALRRQPGRPGRLAPRPQSRRRARRQHPLVDVTKERSERSRANSTPERREARFTLPGDTDPVRHRRGPGDARADRPRRAGREGARLPGPPRAPPRHPRPPRGPRTSPRALRTSPHRRGDQARRLPARHHRLKTFRTGRLNVEPARPATSR